MRNKSIKTRMMMFSILLLSAVLICQIIFNLFFSKQTFLNNKKKLVENLFSDISKDYEDNVYKIHSIAATYEEVDNLSLIIFSETNIIYASRNPADHYNKPIEFIKEMKNFSDDRYVYNPKARDEILMDNKNLIKLTGKLYVDNSPRYVLITTRVESIDNSIMLYTKVSIIISLIVACLGLCFSYIFANKISKPIKNIESIANQVSNLNFSSFANEMDDTLETSNLAKSINKMSNKLSSTINDLQDANNKLIEDINYRKANEEMRKEFIANVSHEMKTPLCLLMMYSENLKNNIPGIDKDYYYDTIIDEANRLNDMVQRLLQISSIENDLVKLNMNTFNLSSLCSYTISKMEVLLKEFDLTLNIEKDIYVIGDEIYIEQVIKNYISNAITHTHHVESSSNLIDTNKSLKGFIKMSLCCKDNEAIFTIINEGNHINDEDIKKIWQSFYMADKSRTRNGEKHFGLGLYIVKTIIEKHHGSCNVENVDNGVMFTFSLPLNKTT